jgi:hypothetical protein
VSLRHVFIPAACLVFVGIGLWQGWPPPAPPRTAPPGPLTALAVHADYGVGVPGQLDVIARTIAALPLDRAIVICKPAGEIHAASTGDTVSYLAWPRHAHHLNMTPQSGGFTFPPQSEPFSAIALCGMHVPETTPGFLRIGPGLEMIVRPASSR